MIDESFDFNGFSASPWLLYAWRLIIYIFLYIFI